MFAGLFTMNGAEHYDLVMTKEAAHKRQQTAYHTVPTQEPAKLSHQVVQPRDSPRRFYPSTSSSTILHNHTKIDLFPGLVFSQEAMKYSSIITNTLYGIINSTHTCAACKWVTTTSSNFCDHEIAPESDIGTGISISKYYTFTKFCYLFNSNKSYTNQNVIIQQPLITTICVNRFHQSRTGRLSKNTAYILCNRSVSLTDFDGQLIGLILHKGSSTN